MILSIQVPLAPVTIDAGQTVRIMDPVAALPRAALH
jgi:hypothetical protein